MCAEKTSRESSHDVKEWTKMKSNRIYHLPDLHDVVLRDGADNPRFDGVPGEVRDFGCVTTMNKLMGTINQ